jgi:hypothetical protein
MMPPRLSGACLVVAAALFWLAWFLMPEPGTTNAAFILQAIAQQRVSVLLSALAQTGCAVAVVLALSSLTPPRSRLVTVGVVLTLVGALGNAADAVYHQMAYEMTAPDVDRAAMLPVMTRMQTEQVWLLVPLLLSFFPGVACLCLGLARAGLAPVNVGRLFAVALAVGLVGGGAGVILGISPRPMTMAALALFSGALGWTGWTLGRASSPRSAHLLVA